MNSAFSPNLPPLPSLPSLSLRAQITARTTDLLATVVAGGYPAAEIVLLVSQKICQHGDLYQQGPEIICEDCGASTYWRA